MRKYMVERYLPGIRAEELDEASARLASAAERLVGQGVRVRYLGSTFIPEEESCFCSFEGASAEDVGRVCDQAGLSFARILETHSFETVNEPSVDGARSAPSREGM